MGEKTLAERIDEVFVNRANIKVPSLNLANKAQKKKIVRKSKFSFSALLNIISGQPKEAEGKKETPSGMETEFVVTKEEKPQESSGGYGTIPKHYGTAPQASYTDYAKLFSYLGKFRAAGPFERADSDLGSEVERTSFALADSQTMDKGSKYVKYFFPKSADFHARAMSAVPVAGMSSAEWEEFRLWMKLDPVMYALKTTLA